MNDFDYKFKARKNASIRKNCRIITRGLRNIVTDKYKTGITVILMFMWIVITSVRSGIGLPPYTECEATVLGGFVLSDVAVLMVIAYIYGRPRIAKQIEQGFAAIGLENSLGDVPELEKITESEYSPELIMEFFNVGLPLSKWQDSKLNIEAILGVVITDIHLMRGSKHVVLKCVRYGDAYANNRRHTTENKNHLVCKVGSKAEGVEYIDFSKTAHAIIGGATGSGKTETLRNILVQCIEQGAETYIVDFKGGLDYSEDIWRRATMITDYDSLVEFLHEIVYKLIAREHALKTDSFKTIEEAIESGAYDTEVPLTQIVIAFDEVAEALDKTGESKETKAVIDKIIGDLSSIARLGRALGIHLILSTQRPDANVIPGQIRNNMTYRLCGHADKVLSQIVLDNSLAAEIPAGCPGIFINQDGGEVHCDRPKIGSKQLTLNEYLAQGVATMNGWE